MPARTRFGRDDIRFRPFGQQKDDLEVDFLRRSRPMLETEILLNCGSDAQGRRLDPRTCWELEVGRRIEGLLMIAALSGINALSISVRCQRVTCGQLLETELTVDEVLEIPGRHETVGPTLKLENANFHLRKPTGADQRLWLDASYPDIESATRFMVETLVAPDQREAFRSASKGNAWIPAAERALEADDPLVDAFVTVRCPTCEALTRHPLDLAGIAIEHLRNVQRQVLMTVQRLALRYHWSEAECFQVPPWRRSFYLRALDQEGS